MCEEGEKAHFGLTTIRNANNKEHVKRIVCEEHLYRHAAYLLDACIALEQFGSTLCLVGSEHITNKTFGGSNNNCFCLDNKTPGTKP